MGRNSNAFERYQRINDVFNLRKGNQAVVTTGELIEKLGIGQRQLRVDMQKMKEIGAPLEYIARERGWRYTSPFDFSESIPLSAEDIMNLHLAVETLAHVNHIPEFKGLPDVFEKIRRSVSQWVDRKASGKSLYFDTLPSYEGSVHLPFFLQAIETKRQVEFDYHSFQAPESKRCTFDPYFLRQHNWRWYAGGFSHDPSEQFIRTYPLERIVGQPEFSGRSFQRPPDFHPKEYWRHILGIYRPPNGKVEKVILEFNYLQGRYFLSSPFFEPFEILEDNSERLVLQMEIMINIELIKRIASYGKELRVREPAGLVNSIKDFYREALAGL